MSLRVTVPVRVPAAVGVNFTLIVQLAPAATELPQVPSPANAKSPLMTKLLLNVSVELPVLVTVTNCVALVVPTAWLAKVNEAGERLATGPLDVEAPVPVRVAVCGLPVALSVAATVAVRVPEAAGVNVTLIVQLAPAATDVPHVLLSAKSPPLVPVTAILVMLKAALPVFESVIAWAALVVPTFWLANVNEVGDRDAVEVDVETPEPVRAAVCGLPVALSVTVTVAVLVPDAVGLNVTLIVQVPPAATDVPHVLLSAKSPLLVPVMAMLVMLRAAFPVLESVIA